MVGRRHKTEVRIVDGPGRVGGPGQAAATELNQVVDALQGRIEDQGKRVEALENLLDQEQRLHRGTQQQLERLLPAPRDTRGWVKRLFGGSE